VVLVAHDQADLDQYRPLALEVAGFCARWGMRYEEILGTTDFFVDLLKQAGASRGDTENFIRVPPGGELRQEQFLRLPVQAG